MKIREHWQKHYIVLFTLGSVLLFLMLPTLAAINAYEFQDPDKEQRFRTLIDELRCPKCQNQSIADSNAPLSQDLRQRVYEMMQDNRSDAEIVQFLVARYGDFITYRPPLTPVTWVLWFGPLAAVVIVALGLGLWIRRRAARTETELDPEQRRQLQNLLTSDEDSR